MLQGMRWQIHASLFCCNSTTQVVIWYRAATKRDRTHLSEGESYMVCSISIHFLYFAYNTILPLFKILLLCPHSDAISTLSVQQVSKILIRCSFQPCPSKQNLAQQITSHDKNILQDHMTAETHSTDSYQNILLSLLHYYRHALRQAERSTSETSQDSNSSYFPSHVTIISHAFKRDRFMHLHVPAIRWPISRTTFVGIDPPEEVTPKSSLEEGERERGWGVWSRDLYGVGPVLSAKRVNRGWTEEILIEIEASLEEGEFLILKGLLEWTGGKTGCEIYPNLLPWEE